MSSNPKAENPIMANTVDYKSGSVLQRMRSFFTERRGSVSVEFAFIMPLLITLYLGTIEISDGLEVNKKIGRAAATIGDALTREKELDLNQIRAVMKVGNSQVLPYARSNARMTVVGVAISSSGAATVDWSQKLDSGSYTKPYNKGDTFPLPAKLKTTEGFVVVVTSQIEYLPLTSWSIAKNKGGGTYAAIDMKETYYFRPRQGNDLDCSNCP